MSLVEQWDDEDGAVVGECDHCGNERPICHLPDPYTSEIYPEVEAEVSDWCYPCWLERHDDI